MNLQELEIGGTYPRTQSSPWGWRDTPGRAFPALFDVSQTSEASMFLLCRQSPDLPNSEEKEKKK